MARNDDVAPFGQNMEGNWHSDRKTKDSKTSQLIVAHLKRWHIKSNISKCFTYRKWIWIRIWIWKMWSNECGMKHITKWDRWAADTPTHLSVYRLVRIAIATCTLQMFSFLTAIVNHFQVTHLHYLLCQKEYGDDEIAA